VQDVYDAIFGPVDQGVDTIGEAECWAKQSGEDKRADGKIFGFQGAAGGVFQDTVYVPAVDGVISHAIELPLFRFSHGRKFYVLLVLLPFWHAVKKWMKLDPKNHAGNITLDSLPSHVR
jgi:hypothetical protein